MDYLKIKSKSKLISVASKKMKLTFGRFPTYREVKEYYTRDGVLEFIRDAAAVRKVVFSFKEEPSIYNEGESPRIEPLSIDELKEHLTQKFARALPERVYPDDKPLRVYPSFHFLTKAEDEEPWDFVMEADCPGWRRSFVDVRGVVEILRHHDVPFMIKFSGHRSLHLIIPREALPEEFREQSIEKSWKELDMELRGFFSKHALVRHAHGTGGLLRLSYSFNENTGLVGVPIHPDELDSFKPWESFHHLVRVDEDFKFSSFIRECGEKSDNIVAFLDAALKKKSISPIPRQMWSFSIEAKPKYAELHAEEPTDKAQIAWRTLVTGAKLSDEMVSSYRYEKNPDIRWLIAESLIGDERTFELLPETDEYALVAIEDSIAYQANISMNRFIDRLQGLSDYRSIRGLHAIFERLELEPLKKELLRRVEITHESETRQLVRCASIIGLAFRDWLLLDEIIRRVEERLPGLLDEMERRVLEAIKGLEARNIKEIREAQKVLVEAGKEAIEQLTLAMTSDKSWMRQRVIEVILNLKDPAFAEFLVNALGDENRRVRRMATTALIKLEDRAKPLLEDAANQDNPMLRSNAVRILGIIEGNKSLGVALAALEDTNIKVRSAAIKSLAKINDKRAHEALRSALWDISLDIGVQAACTLSDFGEEGLKILQEVLAEAEAEGATQAARCIAHGLAKFGDDSVIDHLIAALYDESWHRWNTPWLQIVELKHPRGNDALLDFFREKLIDNAEADPRANRKARLAMRVLSRVEDKRVLPLVREILARQRDKKAMRSGVDLLRMRATELNEREAIRALIELVFGDNKSLAQMAAAALVKIGAEVLPEIETALEETEGNLRAEKLLQNAIFHLKKDEDSARTTH
jgi:HEAT repeat protein